MKTDGRKTDTDKDTDKDTDGDGAAHRGRAHDGARYRTPAGEVILRARRRPDTAAATDLARPERRTGRLRAAFAVLAVVAVAAVLTTVIALVRGGPHTAGPVRATAPSAAPTTTVRPYPTQPAPRTGSSAPQDSAPAGGDISQARQQVAGFVAALNGRDFQRANGFLCASMAGSYGASSLDGIVPGSLAVGGVALRGTTGTAIVTYRLTGSSQPGRTVFGLVVDRGTWLVCRPQ